MKQVWNKIKKYIKNIFSKKSKSNDCQECKLMYQQLHENKPVKIKLKHNKKVNIDIVIKYPQQKNKINKPRRIGKAREELAKMLMENYKSGYEYIE